MHWISVRGERNATAQRRGLVGCLDIFENELQVLKK